MELKSNRTEIDHHTLKFIVGIIAITLAPLTSYLAGQHRLASISDSYHVSGWASNIFVGFLFTIGSFLLAYNGYFIHETILSKIAAIMAIGVALFPCKAYGTAPQPYSIVHYISAVIMFIVLIAFCFSFYTRAKTKNYPQAKVREIIYTVCGLIMVLSVLVIAVEFISNETISKIIPRIIFYGEATALTAFGIAWLTASRILPFITNKDEQLSLSPFKSNEKA